MESSVSGRDRGDRAVCRRTVIGWGVAVTWVLSGCTIPFEGETPTSERPTGHLTLTITNGDVAAHRAQFELRDGTGEVVRDRSVDVGRGETRTIGVNSLEASRYTVEVVVVGRRVQYGWEPADCPELTYEVTVTRDESVTSDSRCP